MPFLSNYVLNNRGNFHLQLLRRFKDIAFSVVVFSLPRPVHCVRKKETKMFFCNMFYETKAILMKCGM